MWLVSTRWPSCCKSCKQPISRTDVLIKGVVEISTCSGGCAWNSEVPLVDSIKIIDGDLAQWEMKVGSNSFLFLNLNNSSFQRIMLGFVCSGMVDCQHESLEDSRWPDVFFVFDTIRNNDESWMKVATQVNSGDIYIIYMYRDIFLDYFMIVNIPYLKQIYERYTVYCFSKGRSF